MATSDMRQLARQRRKPRANQKMPTNYLEIIKKMMSRPYTLADIPPALGITANTFNKKRKEDGGKIDHAIAAGRARLHEELVGPLYDKARGIHTGVPDIELTKWLLARFFDTYNINQRRAVEAANIDQKIVNIIQLPEAMSDEQYMKFVETIQKVPQVIEHDAD